jgi:hypothetical protein
MTAEAHLHAWRPWEIVGGWQDGRDGWVRVCEDCGLSEYRELPPEDSMPANSDGVVRGMLLDDDGEPLSDAVSSAD